MHFFYDLIFHGNLGYINEVVKETLLEVFDDGRLLDLDEQHHVLHTTGLLVPALPVVSLGETDTFNDPLTTLYR